jgi:DNA-directed RNA polymerase subunit RPC12/RpoP
MKLLWHVVRFHCSQCGRFAWESRIPAGADPKKYTPVECGWCSSRTFRSEERAAA